MTRPRTAVHPAAARRRSARPVRSRRRRPVRKGGTRRTTRRPRVAGFRKRRRSARRMQQGRWWPVLLVAVAVVTGVAWNSVDGTPATAPAVRCTLAASGIELSEEQVANARTIAAVGWDRGLPDRAVVIALATAMQESRLRNLPYGDRDSLGLFQQRPSQGWGSEAQVMDPVYAAGMFYDGLVQVPGWDTMRVTDAGQSVQKSAFPEAYERWAPMANTLTTALAQEGMPGVVCG